MAELANRGKWIFLEPDYISRLKMEIENSVIINPVTGCHDWTKSLQSNGYAQKRAFGKMMPAHRASWLAFRGDIPKSMDIAHCCGNRKCVNPDHLKVITHAENMREMALIGNCRRRKVIIMGVDYPSVSAAAKKLNLTPSSIRYIERRESEAP